MSYYTGLRPCRVCGRKFYSDCADVCPSCFEAEREEEARPEALKRISGFRLTIELVPESCWGRSLANMAAPAVWDNITRKVYADAGYKCNICGYGGKLYCHEVWVYDDVKHIQKLGGFMALCELCHAVKHIGLNGSAGRVVRHFKSVNGCSYEDFLMAEDIAFEVWGERSRFDWVQDLGEYADQKPG